MRFSIISGLMILPFATNALSATTALTIEGTRPYLQLLDGPIGDDGNPTPGTKLTTTDELLGFSMWDGTYEADNTTKHMVRITASQTGELNAVSGFLYSDVIALVTANNTSNPVSGATVADGDGDAAIAANTTVSGTMTATWKEGSTVVTDLSKKLSACGGPYTLTISANNVKAKTTYGNPNDSSYTNNTKIYSFKSNGQGICYLKPKEMTATWGYNKAIFDKTKGFKVASGFPKTGFAGAVFSLIGSEANQSKYRCKTANGGISEGHIKLSGSASASLGENCTVTYRTEEAYKAKPTNPVTVDMEYKSDDGTWAKIDSFKIPIPTKWAKVKGLANYKNDTNVSTDGIFPAANLCAGSGLGTITQTKAGSYFFARNDFSNSSVASNPAVNGVIGGNYSRGTGGTSITFMSEWGDLYKGYPGSGFEVYTDIWTSDSGSSRSLLMNNSGAVVTYYPSNTALTVCK